MTCSAYRRRLHRLLDGDPDLPGREALEAHARGCARCAAYREESLRLLGLMRTLIQPVPTADLVDRSMARVRESIPALRSRDRVTTGQLAGSLGASLAAASACTAAILLRAPAAVQEEPVRQIFFWIPRAGVGAGKAFLDTLEAVVTGLADMILVLDRVGSGIAVLGTAQVVLTALLGAAVLGTVTVLVRRDLARTRSGARPQGGTW